jgi:hypothetical protein
MKSVGGKDRNVLEFPRSDIGLRSDILRTLPAAFRKVCFSGYAEHALEGIHEENSYKSGMQIIVR